MMTLNVKVSWTDKNFCCGWEDENLGTVVVTNKSLENLKKDFEESLRWHIEGCVEDGDVVPEFLAKGDYELNFELDTAALLQDAERYTTLAAISRESGINAKQLSHYATGQKRPRSRQREKIIDGLHSIGRRFLSLC